MCVRRSIVRLALAAAVAFAFGASGAFASSLAIVPIQPAPQEHIFGSTPVTFELQSTEPIRIDASAIHMNFDGTDVSAALQVDGARISFRPPRPLPAGAHRVEVTVDDAGGATLQYSWSFSVDERYQEQQAASQAPYDMSGGSSIDFYPASDQPSYYSGSSVQFNVAGPEGGYGYVEFPGLSTQFPLYAYAPGLYYVIVSVPVWYVSAHPHIRCHFWTHGHKEFTRPLDRPVAFVPHHGSALAPAAPAPATPKSGASAAVPAAFASSSATSKQFTIVPTWARPMTMSGTVMSAPVAGFRPQRVAPVTTQSLAAPTTSSRAGSSSFPLHGYVNGPISTPAFSMPNAPVPGTLVAPPVGGAMSPGHR